MERPLSGHGLTLEPAEARHAAGLARAATWDRFTYSLSAIPPALDEEGLASHLATLRAAGSFPYVMVVNGEPVGVSCYLDIRPAHRALEIGSTWIAKSHEGTFVNPAAKLLLLSRAFDELACERVQLKCDGRNARSMAAISKLGAVKEGVLRRHMILPDGYVRDTVMYSIVADEWPLVRNRLVARLAGE